MIDDDSRRLGRVPDKDLAAHGGVARPAQRERRSLTDSKDGELLDRELRDIPRLRKEF